MVTNTSLKPEQEQMKNIIKNYLNTIVYIDDKFGLSLVGEDSEPTPEQPKRSLRRNTDAVPEENNLIYTNPEPIPERDQLSVLLEKMQRKYPDIKLHPIKYSGREDKDYIELNIKSSKLVVIDWQLSESGTQEKYTAVDVIRIALQTSCQMRLLVVYTSDSVGAENDFIQKGIITKFFDNELQGKKFKFAIKSSSIIMLCKKSDFTADYLIEAYADLIITNFGYFPVAFIDMLLSMDKKVGSLLNKFSQPFDSILLMQMENSGVNYNDNTELLRDLVTNSVYDEIQCDPCIVDNMYKERISTLIKLGESDDVTLTQKRNDAIDYILSRCSSDSKKAYKAVKEIPISLFKDSLKAIDIEPENWQKSLERFRNFLIEQTSIICADKTVIEFHEQAEIKPKNPGQKGRVNRLQEKIYLSLLRAEKALIKEVLSNTTSFLLMLLSDLKIGTSINDLIANLKLKTYINDDLDLSKIIIENMVLISEGKADDNCKEKMKNKLFPGDILFKEGTDGPYDFMICITPSCQMFRPFKVDYVISYVRGEMLTKGLEKNIRDSEHISIIPYPSNADRLIGIKWRFHEVINFDLKTRSGIDSLKSYQRQYRLTDDYYRQITSEFNSFYAKVGVEDLFIKNSPDLANFFLK